MFLTRSTSRAACVVKVLCVLGALGASASLSCGARSGLDLGRNVDGQEAGGQGGEGGEGGEGGQPGRAGQAGQAGSENPPDCIIDEECAVTDRCFPQICDDGECVVGAPVLCDDRDECTQDSCEPATGECQFRELGLDQDGDGFYGPRPGYAPGAPGACGDDCNDASDRAFPGGAELCDGVDNDCNGVVDDNATYVPAMDDVIQVSDSSHQQAGLGGIAWNDALYAVSYSAQSTKWQSYSKGLHADGRTAFVESKITNHNSDAYAGNIAWTGAIFGTVWQDRRDNNYEIFFNRLGPGGNKLGPDVRVSNSGSFSVNVDLMWSGTEFFVVWQERVGNQFSILGQRISVDGGRVGGMVELVSASENGESPRLVEGGSRLGLVFNAVDGQARSRPAFRTFAPDLSDRSAIVTLSASSGVGASMIWSDDRFIVAWSTRDVVPGDSIWGATISESGDVIQSARSLTFGASFARTQSLLALGDRLLLTWADDRDGNYEIYSKMLDLNLTDLSPRQRITFDASDTLSPRTAFGPDGDVGVLFEDRRSGSWHVYFARLVCEAGS